MTVPSLRNIWKGAWIRWRDGKRSRFGTVEYITPDRTGRNLRGLLSMMTCATTGCDKDATYCARVQDDDGLVHAVNLCADCKKVARKNFPHLQIVPLYSVARDLIVPGIPRALEAV